MNEYLNEYKNNESMQESRHVWHGSRAVSLSVPQTKEGGACVYSSLEAPRTIEEERIVNGLPQDSVSQRHTGQAYVLWDQPPLILLTNTEGLKAIEFETWMETGRTIMRCPTEVSACPTHSSRIQNTFCQKMAPLSYHGADKW